MGVNVGALLRSLPSSVANAMMAEAAEQVRLARQKKARPYVPGKPNPGPQTRFVFGCDDYKEVLYGGQAGGGKTEGLLRAALRFVHVPRYAAIIFRRTFPMLNSADGFIDRSKDWLKNTDAVWNQGDHRWTWPNGATLTFAHLQHDDSIYNHQGAAYQFIGFDELTQFTRRQFIYLYSRCRRKKDMQSADPLLNVPLSIRATANPGGVGHVWVKKRYIDSPENRLYIAASLKDTPQLDIEGYVENLGELDDITRRQLLHGDWDAVEDGIVNYDMLEACRDTACLWPMGERPAASRHPELYIGVDIGRTTHNTVIYVLEKIGDVLWTRVVRVLAHKESPMTFGEQKAVIKKYLSRDVVKCHVDKGGIGMQLSEELEREHPGLVEGVQLTPGRQGQMANRMKTLFVEKRIRVPEDDDLDEDFQLVRNTVTKNGIPTVATDEGPSGHADRFWAAALALHGVPLTIRKRSTSGPAGYRSTVGGAK